MSESIVFNEDNMLGMARYPDKYFDLAIVDPPYGIDVSNWDIVKPSRPNHAKMVENGYEKYSYKAWDKEIPPKEYWEQLFRVSKNQIVWGGNYFTDFLPPRKGWIYWRKGLDYENSFNFSHGELAWSSFNKQLLSLNVSPKSETNGGKNRIHPTQKPIYLYKWLLENYAVCKHCRNEGGFYEDVVGDGGSKMYVECEACSVAENGNVKILDTHMGSQSSRIAAYDMGFDYYGWELDPDYFKDGCKRFEQFKSQLKIFN